MEPDSDMKINYAVVLKQLQAELDGIEGRRQALAASIAAMSRLVQHDEEPDAVPESRVAFVTADPKASDVKLPTIPPGFFAGKTPTEAYRELVKLWPGYYTPPQIADAFLAGGMQAKSRTQLVQSVHSVLKRERQRLRSGG